MERKCCLEKQTDLKMKMDTTRRKFVRSKILRFSLVGAIVLFLSVKVSAQTEIVIDPNTTYQQIEGWGTSLAWWANIVGGWPEAQQDTIVSWITSPNGLNMNVFRYNIGGGDAPAHNHFRNDGGAVPGFKASSSASYDWTADANQRSILLKLKNARADAIFEAFSNSAPYWMTKSGCSGGNTNGSNNLKDSYYGDFADYLTDVVKHYKDTYGVTFRTLEPMNEPIQNWWVANQTYGQEGCHFDIDKQEVLIRDVYNKLQSKNMLSYCNIAANDESNINQCYTALNSYIQAGDIMDKIAKINTHSYSGSNRSGVYNIADSNNKMLWQSESGPLSLSVSGYSALLVLAQRIITDMRDLKPVAWVDWQVAGWSYEWSQINLDYNNKRASKLKQFYVRMQFSRFLKQNYRIISSNNSKSIAAINPSNNELVVVLCNQNTASQNYVLDLNLFKTTGGNATVYRTSSTENCIKINDLMPSNNRISYTSPAKSVTTIIIPVTVNSSTGIDLSSLEKTNDQFLIYPTIASDYFTIEIPQGKRAYYQIYNSLGKLVSQKSCTGTKTVVQIDDKFQNGVYHVRTVCGEKLSVAKVIVIK